MNPFYFGSSDAQLFGIHHPPEDGSAGAGAVLLCPPFGAEAIAAHRPLLHLAQRLARQGLHVLRFDYLGTGDSAGDDEQVSLAQWRLDVVTALEELRDTSGARRLGVLGLRLGAAVAALGVGDAIAGGARDVEALGLWQPIVDGGDHVAELAEEQRDWQRRAFPRPEAAALAGTMPEVLGYPLPRAMQQELGAIDLLELALPSSLRLLVVEQEPDAAVDALRETLAERGGEVTHLRSSAEPAWVGHPIALPPVQLDERIAQWFAEVLR